MKLLIGAICTMSFAMALPSFAEDSTAIFEKRRKEIVGTKFWCETGRGPMATSLETLNVTPTATCKYGGLLDTKPPGKILEPPFLNPLLKLDALRDFVLKNGGSVESESATRVSFRIFGDSLTANVIPYKQLKDTYMHLGLYPAAWGTDFVSITASSPALVRRFADTAQAQAPMIFSWTNPHYVEETAIWPRMTGGPRPYLPVELVPRCQVPSKWNPNGRALLLVGDTHTVRESKYFLNLLPSLQPAFVMLELSVDYEPIVREFLDARTIAEENLRLDRLLSRFPNDIVPDFREIFRALKRRQIQIILMDYSEPYFNFPFTNTAFHGAIIALRNKFWAERLPPSWNGYGVVLAGVDHFAEVPGHDMQNFILERFPGTTLGLVNPHENCN